MYLLVVAFFHAQMPAQDLLIALNKKIRCLLSKIEWGIKISDRVRFVFKINT